jgi:hypothetical protein
MKPTAIYEVDELADGNFGLAGTSERWADKFLPDVIWLCLVEGREPRSCFAYQWLGGNDETSQGAASG